MPFSNLPKQVSITINAHETCDEHFNENQSIIQRVSLCVHVCMCVCACVCCGGADLGEVMSYTKLPCSEECLKPHAHSDMLSEIHTGQR